jgi:AcrR family transcriptional regulator
MIVIIGPVTAVPAEPSGESTRSRLVAAAIAVFVEQGYENARVHDIARAAGLTTGAIYANYRGKADLLSDAIGARTAVEVDALMHDLGTGHARELLGALGDRLAQHREGPPPLLLDAISAARRDPELAAVLRTRLAHRSRAVAELTDAAKREGAIAAEVDTDAFARFCVTLAMGALVMRTVGTEPPDPAEWHSLIERLLDALAPTGEES